MGLSWPRVRTEQRGLPHPLGAKSLPKASDWPKEAPAPFLSPRCGLRAWQAETGVAAHLPPPARRWSCGARCSASRCPCLRSGPPSPPAGGSARRGTRTLRTGHCAGAAAAGSSRWRWGRAWRGRTRRQHRRAPDSGLQPAAPPPWAGWLRGRRRGAVRGRRGRRGSETQLHTGSHGTPA